MCVSNLQPGTSNDSDARIDADTGGAVAFSLPHALFAEGVLHSQTLCHYVGLREAVRSRWQSPARSERFWEAIKKTGVTPKLLEKEAEKQFVNLLGFWKENHRDELFSSPLLFNTSLKETLIVLSRIQGSIFVPRAQPDYSWRALLRGIYVVRDSGFQGVALSAPFWPQDAIAEEACQREAVRARAAAAGGRKGGGCRRRNWPHH